MPPADEGVPDFSEDVRKIHLPCHLMTNNSRNESFYGRQDILESIKSELLPQPLSQVGPKVLKLCGPGGIGKTQVAIEYAHSMKYSYDAIFWVQADEPGKLSQGFTTIAIELGLADGVLQDSRDEIVTKNMVLQWLANPRAGPDLESATHGPAKWLIIFDNVDSPDVLNDYWPQSETGSGSILITARDPAAMSHHYPQGKLVILEPFKSEETTEFLLRITGRETDEAARKSCERFSAKVGGYPLAITQVAGILNSRNLSADEFAGALNDDLKRQVPRRTQSGLEGEGIQQGHMLDKLWELENLSQGSILLLDVVALLDPDGIPEYIFEKHHPHIKIPGYPEADAAYRAVRRELLQSSLILRDQSSGKITIHRLFQKRARSHMNADRFDIVFRLAVDLVRAAWPFEKFGFGHDNASWGICAQLFPHVVHLERYSDKQKEEEFITELSLQFPKLLGAAGRFNHQRGRSMESMTYFEKVMTICEQIEKKLLTQSDESSLKLQKQVITLSAQTNHDIGCIATETNQPHLALEHFRELKEKVQYTTAESHFDIGCVASETNKPLLALQRFQAFNMIVKSIVKGVPQRTDKTLAVSWNELGVANMMNGNWSEGEACFLRSIEELKHLDSYTPVDASFPVTNLGYSFWLQGRLDEAGDVLGDMLEVRERILGVDDKTGFLTGKLLHVYGNVETSRGNLDKAFEFHKRALIQYTLTIGTNHHRTGDLCVKVSDHYIRLQQYDHAMKLLNQALKTYGNRSYYSPEKARALFKKGNLLKHLDASDPESEIVLNGALELYKSIDSPHVQLEKGIEELDDGNFDKVVVFWSR